MKRGRRLLGAAAILLTVAGVGVATLHDGKATTPARQESRPVTAAVMRGSLAATVSLDGTLTHRTRSDGSPYVAINHARGIYTALPENGESVGCGGVLYRVNDRPVLMLCGRVPVYRSLRSGDRGRDVRQLNRNLHLLHVDADAGVHVDPGGDVFTARTQQALRMLQRKRGCAVTGALGLDDVVFLPEPVQIAKVTAGVGTTARPGEQVARATSQIIEVQVSLDPSQEGVVKKGDRTRISLPDNTSTTGTVNRIGKIALAAAGQNGNSGQATVPVYVTLDHPARARGFDAAPVQLEITTTGVDNALSVPVTAILGKAGGGFAVEVVGDAGQSHLVAVKLGLFDTTAGRVQVDGDLHAGDHVVVPSP